MNANKIDAIKHVSEVDKISNKRILQFSQPEDIFSNDPGISVDTCSDFENDLIYMDFTNAKNLESKKSPVINSSAKRRRFNINDSIPSNKTFNHKTYNDCNKPDDELSNNDSIQIIENTPIKQADDTIILRFSKTASNRISQKKSLQNSNHKKDDINAPSSSAYGFPNSNTKTNNVCIDKNIPSANHNKNVKCPQKLIKNFSNSSDEDLIDATINPVRENISKLRQKLLSSRKSSSVKNKDNNINNFSEDISFPYEYEQKITDKMVKKNVEKSLEINQKSTDRILTQQTLNQFQCNEKSFSPNEKITNADEFDMSVLEISSQDFEDEIECPAPTKQYQNDSYDRVTGRTQKIPDFPCVEAPVRKKNERALLQGFDCKDCAPVRKKLS